MICELKISFSLIHTASSMNESQMHCAEGLHILGLPSHDILEKAKLGVTRSVVPRD